MARTTARGALTATLSLAFTLAVPSVAHALPAVALAPTTVLAVGRLVGVAVALVIAAYLVGRFAPTRRRRLRASVIMLGAYAACVAAAFTLGAAGFAGRAAEVWWLGHLIEAFILINLATIALFEVVLRWVRVAPAVIISDVALGIAYLVTFFHALHDAGVNLSSIVATSAIVSGVLGLALAPTIGNILGGVALQLDDSIHEGDWIQLDANTQGRVKAIRWRHTVVETRNWDTIIVPNATLLSGSITILGKRTDQPSQRRYWVYFNVDFRHAPSEVIRVVDEALSESPIPNVAAEPRAHTICFDLARDGRDSFAFYAVRYFLTDLAVDDPTSSLVRERVHTALRRAGIPLAMPAAALFVSQDDENRAERKEARELARRVGLLESLEFFRAFTEEERARLAEQLQYVPFARGEVMTRQGREARWLYILAAGEANVEVSVNGGPGQKVSTLVAPTYFGEMGLLTGESRSATVTAAKPSECYRLHRDVFRAVLKDRKELVDVLSAVIARRRAELDAVREDLSVEQKTQRMHAERVRLFSQIERFFGLSDDRPRD